MRPSLAALLALALPFASCDDGGAKLPIGAGCSVSAQCETGICGGSECLDPQVDTDADGLLNAVEAALRTDPVLADTDADGLEDLEEVGADVDAPADSDDDGLIDARESAVADCDRDGLVDQEDADDGIDAKGVCVAGSAELCYDPTNQAPDNPLYYRVSGTAHFFFLAAAGVGYEVVVTPDADANFDLYVFETNDAMCSDGEPLGASTSGLGQVERVTLPPGEIEAERFISIVNRLGGDVGFELDVRALSSDVPAAF